jgi:hypothetical protein
LDRKPGAIVNEAGGLNVNPRTVLVLALLMGAIGAASYAQDAPAARPAPAPNPASAPVPPPADFKLTVGFYGVGKDPITTAELVVHKGTAYLFASESPKEIVIFDPGAERLELVDVGRKLQSEIMLARLEHMQAVLHKSVDTQIRKREAEGGRGNRIAAEMSRALIDPGLSETYEAATHHVRLTNSLVTVDATGEPEPDAARLAIIDASLSAFVRLDSTRDLTAIPPFIRLDTLHALTVGHRLRPTELSFVYRLAGPPRKHRWTYRLVETLTGRELEALNRVIRLREQTRFVPFEKYEKQEASP